MSRPESREERQESSRGSNAPRKSRAARDSAGSQAESSQEQGARHPEENGAAPANQLYGWSFRDFLIPYILLALSMERAHGYLIEQYLRGLGLANLELSTLYRTLRQLEKDGLVNSSWEPGPEGPARRIYSLTDAGRWWLDAGAATLAGYRTLIDRFFGSYPGQSRDSGHNQHEKGTENE